MNKNESSIFSDDQFGVCYDEEEGTVTINDHEYLWENTKIT